jgi:hypothetical protein
MSEDIEADDDRLARLVDDGEITHDELRAILAGAHETTAGPDFPYVVVVGFRTQPEAIYQAIEGLGGEVLQESAYAEGGEVERMPWWKYLPWRLLWRLGIKLPKSRSRGLRS